jgi:sigma-B regulation protein RsbU (phosphoserine phosphatase)
MADEVALREELRDRRHRLVEALGEVGVGDDFVRLIREVDSALERVERRSFGTCMACRETVEDEMLLANPMMEYCLCRLTPEQQEALQRDLDLASKIQWALLPKQDLRFRDWEVHHRYLPAGPVSGDFCDVVTVDKGRGGLFFVIGDVSGKGVAASFLMARLNALFRGLVDTDLELDQLVDRTNRIFSDSNISSQYATLVCGRALRSGEIEICNAGHLPPLVLGSSEVTPVEATGLPVGLFKSGPYTVSSVTLAPGDSLFLYTDGLSEARNGSGEEYGFERLSDLLQEQRSSSSRSLAAACLRSLEDFLSGVGRTDDLSLMVIRRVA